MGAADTRHALHAFFRAFIIDDSTPSRRSLRRPARGAAHAVGAPMSVPLSVDPDAIRAVDDALMSRRSIRAFLPTPVPRDTIEAILDASSRAPSGGNIQPWRTYVATGATRDALAAALIAAHDDPERDDKYVGEYAYYPLEWTQPYLDRRRKVGVDLYKLLDIGRGEKARMHAQHARNFHFFDAPVALFFTVDRVMTQGAWLDCGMFVQSVMIAARARGLDTCPQAAFVPFHRVIAAHLGMPDNEQFVCGMSLGYADPDAIENRLVTERAPIAEFVRFFD
jgi:nitroreductase